MFDLYLHHGRTDPAANMDDWGFEGPRLSGVVGIHMTYATHLHVLFASAAAMQAAADATGWEIFDETGNRLRADIVSDLVQCGEGGAGALSYFGDWGLMLNEAGQAHALLHAKGPIPAPAPPPAPAVQPDPLADLDARYRARIVDEMGFELETVGGGANALTSYGTGGNYVMVSCFEGGGLPTPGDWHVCAYSGRDPGEPILDIACDPADAKKGQPLGIFEAVAACLSVIAERGEG